MRVCAGFWQAEDTDEEIDDDTDVSSLAFQEDALLTSNYRDMTTHVKSARLDALVSAGLGLPRKYVLVGLLTAYRCALHKIYLCHSSETQYKI